MCFQAFGQHERATLEVPEVAERRRSESLALEAALESATKDERQMQRATRSKDAPGVRASGHRWRHHHGPAVESRRPMGPSRWPSCARAGLRTAFLNTSSYDESNINNTDTTKRMSRFSVSPDAALRVDEAGPG